MNTFNTTSIFPRMLLLSLCLLTSTLSFAQASWETFGQNRVQYRKFDWYFFDSTHFRVFYYDQGKANALYAMNMAEQELTHIVYLMGGQLSKKLNIVLYNNFSEYRQTNIGLQNEELNRANGGKLDVVGDNIPIYFNGDHNHLKQQIFRGIASVIKDNMLFGDNIKDVVKNAIKMNLPEWYTSGYVSYISDNWTVEKEKNVEQIIQRSKKKKFNDWANENPSLIGHSFWHYIAAEYGENTISNLLYLTRYRKSVNSALENVLNKPTVEIFNDWASFYLTDTQLTQQLSQYDPRKELTRIPIKPLTSYSMFTVSPNGTELAYVTQKDGLYQVMIQDLRSKKSFTVIDGGHRVGPDMTDPNYPIICWSATGKKMAILYQVKNKLVLKVYHSGEQKKTTKYIPASRIDRITGMSFMTDETNIAVTAIRKGQSDLYKLNIFNARFEPISYDMFDDKTPVSLQNELGTGILFLSNRIDNYLRSSRDDDALTNQFNLFLYSSTTGNNLKQLSHSGKTISQPIQWGRDAVAYLQETERSMERKIIQIIKRQDGADSLHISSSPLFGKSIINHSYIQKTAQLAEIEKQYKEYIVYLTPIDDYNNASDKYLANFPEIPDTTPSIINQKKISEYITQFNQADTNGILESIFTSNNRPKNTYLLYEGNLKKIKAKPYTPSFYPNFIQSTLDNTLLFNRYQPFDYNTGIFQNPPISGLITTTLADIMEDYRITGGGRLGSDLNSLTYFLQYNNYRGRLDWGITYLHTASRNEYDQRNVPPPFYSPYPVLGRLGTQILMSTFSYPLDFHQSFRLQTGIRYDRLRIKSLDQFSLEIPSDHQYWSFSRFEYVYDNTIMPILNIWKGSRAKLFTEYQYQLNKTNKWFVNVGYDLRNYTSIYKNIIIASRLAGAHSAGNAKVLYLLGGVDNDLFPRQDNNTSIDFSQNYAFQTIATNMRGYRQGNRNGNSFMVINEEIRLPIYNTFFKRPIKSSLLRELQFVAFTDIGSAWRGVLPNSDNIRSDNFVQDPNSPVTVFIENNKQDFNWGYGAGLRTKVIGYFLRTDLAWNINGSKKPMLHVSMATDF